ncbi:hypothetical protein PYCC9005_004852 [Savitreella phatthalungensis]
MYRLTLRTTGLIRPSITHASQAKRGVARIAGTAPTEEHWEEAAIEAAITSQTTKSTGGSELSGK